MLGLPYAEWVAIAAQIATVLEENQNGQVDVERIVTLWHAIMPPRA
jgi:hypothetical protein